MSMVCLLPLDCKLHTAVIFLFCCTVVSLATGSVPGVVCGSNSCRSHGSSSFTSLLWPFLSVKAQFTFNNSLEHEWMNEWIAVTWFSTRCYSKGFPCNYSWKGVLHISFPFHFHPTLTSSITLFFIFSLHLFSSCFSIGNFEIILYFPISLH